MARDWQGQAVHIRTLQRESYTGNAVRVHTATSRHFDEASKAREEKEINKNKKWKERLLHVNISCFVTKHTDAFCQL
jgi:hypothetical protein